MTRTFDVNLVIPPIDEPVIAASGQTSDSWRRFFENISTAAFFEGSDLIKQSADDIATLSTDYYTKAEADNRYALAASTYTKTEVLSFLSGKADVSHTHVISDVSGLATALAGKVAVTNLTDLPTSGTSTVAEIEAAINAINAVLRG